MDFPRNLFVKNSTCSESPKNIFIVLSGFEPLSRAPKARRIDHYPTGLHVKAFTYRLIHVLNFCASSGLFRVNFSSQTPFLYISTFSFSAVALFISFPVKILFLFLFIYTVIRWL